MRYILESMGIPVDFDINSDYTLDTIYIMIEEANKDGRQSLSFEHGPSDYDEISEQQANQLRSVGFNVVHTEGQYIVSWKDKNKAK